MRLRSVSLLAALPFAARLTTPTNAAAVRTTYLLHSCVAGAPATATGSAKIAVSAWVVLCSVQASHASGARLAALGEAAQAAREVLDAEWNTLAQLTVHQDSELAYNVRTLLTRTVVRYADAAGWTLAQQGDLTEGTRLLGVAATLDSTAGARWPAATSWYHLGEAVLRQGDSTAALQDYQIALAREVTDLDWILPHKEAVLPTLPAEARIRSLYTAMHHGDTTGVTDALAGDTLRARAAILATRLPSPALLPAFHLVSLDGQAIASASLRGKVVVINGWGTWCSWCVAELPDYQRLYEHYKTDPM